MSWKDIGEKLEGKGWVGVGLGALVLAPILIPPVARRLRPVAKGAIKGYFTLQDRAREMLAETGEQFQDLVAGFREHLARAEYDSGAADSEMMTLDQEADETEAAAGESSDEETKSTRSRRGKSDEPAAETPAEAA